MPRPQFHPTRLFWRRVFLAPLCLCAVAALHAYRVSACRQTPWKGGGFGMFSTVESEESRFLRCWKQPVGCTSESEMHAETDTFPVPKSLSREELRVRVAPTEVRLERLAGALHENEHAPVQVQLWQYRFDAASGKLLATKQQSARGTP